ncbi:GIY-YIG nuclease family protein [Nioella sediminis]|jgi:hypothetical protein|uniref:GIY-YIG nuclease family protein n=1 Tax=Nioella sediminis TaxID=1912092 RepID=UPI0008FD4E8D|nr:GIY-YIG nuclease family protein [Nioella sediminis]TBX16329.1 hypothetical protein TK43_17400 [Roseovarius sp. JS7-11]
MTAGRSLELYFVDGKPDGMLTAEVFNWTGHVLRIPRTQLAEGIQRPEASQTGVYLLLGADEDGPLAYVGEAEMLSTRIREHLRIRNWWSEVVIITTKGDALNKAHVKYLESRIVEKASATGTYRLDNGNIPPRSSLNEASAANMESFLSMLDMVLPAIRVDLLHDNRRGTTAQSTHTPSSMDVEFMVSRQNREIQARMRVVDGELVVLAGARIRPTEQIPDYLKGTLKHRQTLHSSGDIKVHENYEELLKDYAFNSPSGASDFVLGVSSSGPKEWIHERTRQTYADWEAEQLERAPR